MGGMATNERSAQCAEQSHPTVIQCEYWRRTVFAGQTTQGASQLVTQYQYAHNEYI